MAHFIEKPRHVSSMTRTGKMTHDTPHIIDVVSSKNRMPLCIMSAFGMARW